MTGKTINSRSVGAYTGKSLIEREPPKRSQGLKVNVNGINEAIGGDCFRTERARFRGGRCTGIRVVLPFARISEPNCKSVSSSSVERNDLA